MLCIYIADTKTFVPCHSRKMDSHYIWALSLLRRTQSKNKPAFAQSMHLLKLLRHSHHWMRMGQRKTTVGSVLPKSFPYRTTQCYIGFPLISPHLIHFPLLQVIKKYFNEHWIRYLGTTMFRRTDFLEYKIKCPWLWHMSTGWCVQPWAFLPGATACESVTSLPGQE